MGEHLEKGEESAEDEYCGRQWVGEGVGITPIRGVGT